MLRGERQTTVLVGSSSGTAALCATLGDASVSDNIGHVLRVVAPEPQKIFTKEGGAPRLWRCHEQIVSNRFLPARWKTHIGAPDSVLDLSDMERAITGNGTHDDGGVADVILLCCPVSKNLTMLRRIARALYKLNSSADAPLLGSRAPPLLIGALHNSGGFDWMARIAFLSERTDDFQGWSRPLSLFGFLSSPFTCHLSNQPGVVLMSSNTDGLKVALCPTTPEYQRRANITLLRLFPMDDAKRNSAGLDFLTLHMPELDEESSLVAAVEEEENIEDDTLIPSNVTWNDLADPLSSLSFLSCTMNATSNVLQLCLLGSLFDEDADVDWSQEPALPDLVEIDASTKAIASSLFTDITVGELYPLMVCLESLLAPPGTRPISRQYAPENVWKFWRFVCEYSGNSPPEVAFRSGLVDLGDNNSSAKQQQLSNLVRYRHLTEASAHFSLAHDPRLSLGAIRLPAVPVAKNGKHKFSGDLSSNFTHFWDSVPHVLCVFLGLGELVGFQLERDMPETLSLVCKLQRWKQKEYVLPAGSSGSSIVASARDAGETSAPQAFGIDSMEDFRSFLRVPPLGDDGTLRVYEHVSKSAVGRKVLQSRL